MRRDSHSFSSTKLGKFMAALRSKHVERFRKRENGGSFEAVGSYALQ